MAPEPEHAWWRVMCLTGVDYFSTLGYQPGIAFLAAGLLLPVATLILLRQPYSVPCLFTGTWRRRARMGRPASDAGEAFSLMGRQDTGADFARFATTDFVITMTLSAADAAAHFVQNPFTPGWMKGQMAVTLVPLGILGGIFLRGLKKPSVLRSHSSRWTSLSTP